VSAEDVRVRIPPPALAVALAAAAVLAALASRVGDWAVMTDELLYERLAISIAEGGLPRLHGEIVAVYTVLYPLLLAPVFGLVSMPGAIVVAHAWNGVLFASAAVPMYLLARRLPLPAWTPWLAAVFTVALPWSVVTGFVMTESAAYPAAMWAFLAIHSAVVAPRDATYAVAFAAIAAATLARPQFAILALVLVVVVALQELRFRRGLRPHRVLVAAFVVAAVGAIALGLLGSLGAPFGAYGATLEEGRLLSADALRSAVAHLNVVAAAVGLVPLLLGGGWAVASLVHRPGGAETHAFAALVTSTVLLLSLQTGSVVVRFGVGLGVKDRYLFYLAPLLFLATAAALADPRVRVAGVLAATGFVVVTASLETFEPVFGVNLDSPASALHEALTNAAGALGVQATTLVATAAAAIAAVLIFALRTLPRAPVAVVVLGATTLFCALETGYTWDRLLDSSNPVGRPITDKPRRENAWIDRALPDDAEVGMLAYSVGQEWVRSAVTWWDVEFWNARVTRAYLIDDYFAYTPEPFPRPRLAVDAQTGRILGEPPPYLVRTTIDARFRPAGDVVATGPEFEVVRLAEPARADWMTIGLDPDGWTRAGTPSAVRVFGGGLKSVLLTLNSPEVPIRYVVGSAQAGTLGPTRVLPLEVIVCIPPGGTADIPVRIDGTVAVRDISEAPPYAETFRHVGARLSSISVATTASSC
jgi:hypothetical protein